MRAYNTEIISVGTELLLGHVTNTDARDISEQLSKIGINVKYHTVVGDNPERLAECVEIAKQRVDIIITTGGLGPTCDDLTKQILAKCFGLPLVRDEKEYEGLYDYIHPDRAYTPNNYEQAMLPQGCTVFHNTNGTAPGCAFEAEGKTVIMVPGPPKECAAMLRVSVIPYLKQFSDEQIVSHSLRVFGLGESTIDYMFRDEMNAMTNPTMAPYAKEADCLLQITAKAKTEAEAEAMIAPVMDKAAARLGEFLYGVDVECVEESVIRLLQEKHMTFAAAESCTGGELAKRFTDLPGASAVFKGGIVCYTNEIKINVLGVDEQLIREKTAVSREVVMQMAQNVRRLMNTDIGVGVTGVAGPASDGVHPVGNVFVAVATKDDTWVEELWMGTMRSRSFVRRMSGNIVFDMMRRALSGLPVETNYFTRDENSR